MSARLELAARLERWTGFDMSRGGRADALDRLLAQRTKALGLPSVDAYVAALARGDEPEAVRLVNALTVGHTWFFRDAEQTACVADVLGRYGRATTVRVWVAGCSTGEEAFTVALLATELGIDVDVLATDLNSEALEQARSATYGAWAVREVRPERLATGFRRVGASFVVAETVRSRVRFERHNLLDAAPRPTSGAGWDVILCRNVLIYFRADEAAATIERFRRALSPSGWLFLGASEVLRGVPSGFSIEAVGARYALRPAAAAPADARTHAQPTPVASLPSSLAARGTPSMGAGDLVQKALARVEAGEPAEALALCGRALEADSLSAYAHLVSGMALHLTGDWLAAARSLRSALLLEPDEWLASFYLALAYDRIGREADAEREYESVHASLAAGKMGRSSLPSLEAYRGEIALLAKSRASRGKLG